VILALLLAAAAAGPCDKTNPAACMDEALALIKKSRYREAVEVYERGCALDSQVACSMAASLYSGDIGLPKDAAKQAEYEAKSGALLDKMTIYSDEDVRRDRERQQRIVTDHAKLTAAEQACQEGLLASCDKASELYLFTDPNRAYELAAKTAKAVPDKYHPFSGDSIAEVLMRQGKVPQAHAILERACNDGFWAGCKALSEDYLSARWSLPYDPRKGLEYADKACVLGDEGACNAAETVGKKLDPAHQAERKARLQAAKDREQQEKDEEARMKTAALPYVARLVEVEAEGKLQEKERVKFDRLATDERKKADPEVTPEQLQRGADWSDRRLVRRAEIEALIEEISKEMKP
jgi:hypothetical protein